MANSQGEIFFQFVRFWARQWDDSRGSERGRDVMTTEAVLLADAGEGARINDIADVLRIDQSGASRLVTEAMERGYLEKDVDPADRRQRVVRATAAGMVLLAEAHRWQGDVFEKLTTGWSDEDRDRLVVLMQRLMRDA